MDHTRFGCQVCLATFYKVYDLKTHMQSTAHLQKTKDIFKKDLSKGNGIFPPIELLSPQAKLELKLPVLALSLCFSQELKGLFYLCHVCEEKCPSQRILWHLSSTDHGKNYFNYTNPNSLSFSWIPSKNTRDHLRPEVTKKAQGTGELQLLDLPGHLLIKLDTYTYSEVTCALGEYDKLSKLLEVVKPKRMMLQTYQRDSSREHPLLGMQHLVECICVGPTEKRYYLCTLCKLTLATNAIIQHVLSFDHIFCYFRAWHPSTLLSKESYRFYTKSFASMMLDFAKQAEEIHSTANNDMKQVSLEPAKFTSVNFTCYREAFKELESIRKENQESSLMTIVKQGNKLGDGSLSYKLHCQNCSWSSENMFLYCTHVSTRKHKLMVTKLFGADCNGLTDWNPNLGLYREHKESLQRKKLLIGASLVVMFVSSHVQNEAFYICFACEDSFSESSLRQHFDSTKHLVHTLLYQNPWRLTFGWENRLDVNVLRSMALEEEKERKSNERTLKVLDLPNWMFQNLVQLSYRKVMENLDLHHTVLKRGVPERETYSKLKQNERFPLLGSRFLVMHSKSDRNTKHVEMGFLCLLCQRTLSGEECHAHVFSREHVARFLDRFHPGSLTSSTDAETLMDLAKQAGRVHTISHIQVIKLDMPIWEPYSYSTAITILTSAKWRVGKAELEPTIIPKQKLVPRETLKDVNKNHVRDNSQKNVRVMEGCENTTSQKTTDTSETSPKRISEEVGAKVTDTRCVQKGDEKETPTPSEKGLEKRGEVSSRSSEEMKKAVSETCQAIKMKKMDEPAASEMPQSCKNTDKEDGTPIGKEKSKSVKDVLNQKRIISCPVEDVKQEISHKMEPLASREDAAREESQNLPSSGQKQGTPTDEGESGKPIHETEKGKDLLWQYLKRKTREPVVGLSALLECQCDERDPVYLCECCSLKIPEKDVISHVTGVEHQKIYLGGLKKLPPLPLMHQEKMIGYFAAMFEQENGYGEAQVVDLDDEMYNSLSKQSFKSAIQTVKVLQDQQDGGPGLPSTSALSGVQPVDTSVGLHAQPELCSVEDDYEVVEMEIDDDHEESEAQPHSETTAAYVMTETTCKTTGAPPESNEGVKMTQIKVESADNTHTCRTVSRSSEVKAEIIINTSVAPVKTASTSRAAISSTVAKVTATTSCKAATVANKEPTVVREAACRTAPASKTKNTSKPEAAANMTKMSVKWDKTEVSVTVTQLKNSVGSTVGVAPNVQKSKAPAAPNPNPTTTKNPPTEPSHNFTSTKRPSENPPAVAVKRLKAIVRPRDVRVSSPSTTDSTEVLRPQVTFASPASSPADGMYVPHNEELSPDNQSEQENEHGLQTLLTSILDAGVAVKMGKPQSYAIPLATGSEGRFAQTPGTCRDAPEKRRPQEGRDPELQDKQDKGSRETVPVKLFNPDPLSSDATGNRERQNQPRFSLKPERVSSHSQAVAIISIGESSHLSRYLRVTGLDREPIIGLGFVWECRGMSESPFFLCESCMEMISHNDICEHMMRSAHKLKYIMLHHDFLFFWRFEFLLKEMKQYIVEGIVGRLSKCERHNKVDAQCILLRPGLFEYVRSLPFSEALKMVKDIKKEPKLPWPTTCTPEQQGAGKKKEKYNSEKTVGDLDGVKPRRVLSPVDVASGSSNADAVVSPDSSAGTCLSPQKQPETRPPDSQHQRPVPELQVKKEEVHSEYPSSCIFGPTTSQTPSVSPRDECSPTKKRPPAESIETQVRSGTNDPQLEDHLPAIYKPTYSKLRPISQPSPESAYEPTSVDPSATSTLLSPEDKDAGPGSDISTVDRRKLACLIALVRKRKSELNIYHCTSAPDNGDTATSCAYYTSKSGVERTWDPKSVQTTYNMVNVTHNPPSTNSFKEMFSTAAAPVVLGHENQLVSPNSISANFANKSSLEGSTSTRGNFWFGATEAKTVGSIFPSASTGDSSGAQHQRSVEAQSNFGNANQPSPIFCAVTNDNPQPRDNTQTDSTGVPINTIVTARPNHANHQFVDGYNVQEHAEGNQGIQVTHPAFIHNPTAANIEVLFKASAN